LIDGQDYSSKAVEAGSTRLPLIGEAVVSCVAMSNMPLMLHACATRFYVIENLKNFLDFECN